MIQLTRLNGKKMIVNCEFIKFIESAPDTIITLVSGEKMMVKESPEEVIQETMSFRKKIFQEPIINLNNHQNHHLDHNVKGV